MRTRTPDELIDGLGPPGAISRTGVAGQERGSFKNEIDKYLLTGHG